MMNQVALIGRLTKDVELRYTQGGDAVGSFTIAVERNYSKQDGTRDTDFIQGVIWRKQAENFANFTGKGALVGINGELQTRNYQNNQGQTVYVTEVNVTQFSLLETRSQAEARRNQNENDFQQSNSVPQQNADAPWNNQPNNDTYDMSESDLPFD